MANKIMINLYGKEGELADIARYTNIDTSTLRDHYNKHRNRLRYSFRVYTKDNILEL